ncbi:MAG: hypothetical protein JW701_00495 [Kosmotogaceae bacterium]|nr:hypothetical protein [Kosmotogaceae bacterium]
MGIKRKTILISILLGILLTFVFGQIVNDNIIGEFPNIRFSDMPLLGTTYWGYPLAVYKMVLYPGSTRQVLWIHLMLDVIYWSVLVLIIESLVGYKKREKLAYPRIDRAFRKKTKGTGKKTLRKKSAKATGKKTLVKKSTEGRKTSDRHGSQRK